ncbi:unnamed protein product, partial [Choristocarpus tenellus]
VVIDCLSAVGSLLDGNPSMMDALANNPLAQEFVVAMLTGNPHRRVRKEMSSLLIGATPMAPLLLRWLTEELEGLKLTDTLCDEFFNAVRDIVAANCHPVPVLHRTSGAGHRAGAHAKGEAGDGEALLDLRPLAAVLSRKLMAMPRNGRASCQRVLCGCLGVLHDLVEIEGPDGDLLVGTEIGENMVGKIFSDFLFTMPEQRGRGMPVEGPVCTEPMSRRAALSVLAVAARKSPRAMATLLDNVDAFVGQVTPSLRNRWGYEASFDAKRCQSGRFVGLKNQGCTCYMNSLLQQ